MSMPFDYEGLWTKAVLFANRSFSAKDSGEFDVAALWASLSLELIGKAALAKINPTLIADPSDDGKSLLIAARALKDQSGFRSIQAKTVFSRCARVFHPFDAKEAGLIAQNRNDELHSALLPFAAIPEKQWWERYWAQVVILVGAQDRDLVDFVGADRVDEIEQHLADNKANVHRRVVGLVTRAKQRLELLSESALPASVESELQQARSQSDDYLHKAPFDCPACEAHAWLLGDVGIAGPMYFDDDGVAWEDISVYADAFRCGKCGLVLERAEFVVEAGLPEEFEVTLEAEPDFGEYGND